MSEFIKKHSQLNQKKKAALLGVLSITIALSMSSCTETKQITPEKAVDIYMENKDKWMLTAPYGSMNNSSYGFLDVDFDGILELAVNSKSGTGSYSQNTYYKINQDTQTVEVIEKNTPYNKNGEYDINNSIYTKLYKNNSSGEMFYYCYDYLRVSTGENYVTFGILSFDNNIIEENPLFMEHNNDATIEGNEDLVNEYWCYENGVLIKTDESTYKSKQENFYSENTDLYLMREDIYYSEFDSADEETQRELLLEKYKKFSYDGYKENTYQDDGSGPEVISKLTEDFIFSSGAGAWGTVVSVNSDGSFTVDFHDGEVSLKGEDYPNGTMYKADATGNFSDIKRINDYTYSMKISELTYEKELGTEEIINDIKYVYRTAYGLENAKRVYLYTPDAPISELPQSLLNWVGLGGEQEKDKTLGFYALYNVDEQNGFRSNNK